MANFKNGRMKIFKKTIFLFCFKLGVFFLVLGIIIIFFILPFVSDIGNDKRYLYALNELKNRNNNDIYDAAFFGNSYSFTAYDPSIFRSRLGLNAIHLNSGSQLLETSLIVAKEQLQKNDLKYVFFEVSGASLRRPTKNLDEYWYYQTIALQELPFSWNKLKYTLEYFPTREFRDYFIAALSKNAGRAFRLNERKNYKKRWSQNFKTTQKTIHFSTNGFLANRQKPISKTKFEKEFYLPAYVNKDEVLWTPKIIAQVRDFIEYAKSKNTQVIFIQSLKLYATVFDTRIIETFKSDYDNVNFLDLNSDRNTYDLDHSSYYDSTHVNYPASYQVTNRLIDSLSTWYNIPYIPNVELDFKYFKIDNFYYCLDKTQDKFIKIEFDSLPEGILNDHKLVIGIYPKDLELLSLKAKERKRNSDDFIIDVNKDYFEVGTKKIIIKRIETKIDKDNLKKVKLYFHKKGDTLGLKSYEFSQLPK
ncbi:MAG: hypothetical protein ACJA1Z_003014 [Patiriisocius sp.]|jgi:hypothetical protein